ncbi:MAG: CRISPR-associated endonuclease Cas6 [Bacteroidales bacterium]|nr:CRISPR-associated endonuclease Cas6 [Bacteroidales bacterium]
MKPLPILTINLLDVKIPANSSLMTAFLNGMRDVAVENQALFEEEGIPADIFHNDKIAYSGIQFTNIRGSASITAVGPKEVRALELWYEIFQKSIGNPEQNTLIIKEQFIGQITKVYLNYKANSLLLKSEIGYEIENLQNQFAIHDRLEKYLYGNIKAFLVRVAGMEIGEHDYISVKVHKYKNHGLKSTFHGGKLPAFDIYFSTNVTLPHTLRLGQAVSLGYGNVVHTD